MVNETDLKDLIQAVLGSQITVDWAREPEHWPGFSGIAADGTANVNSPLGAQVTLSWISIVGVGVDDMRRTYDPDEETQTVTQVGSRHLDLQCLVECSGEISAGALAERLITGFQRKSTLNALRELGCAMRRAYEVKGNSVPAWDTKFTDSTVVEVQLTWGLESLDPIGETGTEVPNNWIESVSTLTFTRG